MSDSDSQRVVVTDVRMDFSSMIVFMVKWALASIPAILILMLLAYMGVQLIAAFSSNSRGLEGLRSSSYPAATAESADTQDKPSDLADMGIALARSKLKAGDKAGALSTARDAIQGYQPSAAQRAVLEDLAKEAER